MGTTTKTVKVTRSFYYNKQLHKVGTVLELPSHFANEVMYSNKAELVTDVTPVQAAQKPVVEKKAEK